ncbi:MAG: hypothetical protein H0W74_13245 [Sphingosinicella sp.]|nr:hypothetical protein [Sphingosinicella sp.]
MEASAKRPAHLWIVGILAALWNAFGCVDYTMTQTRNEAWLANFTPDMVDYVNAFPAWAEAAWALGVWGGLAGSLLLLARSRYAVTAFAVSLVGLLGTTIYQFAMSELPASMTTGGMIGMNVAIWIVAIALFLYARRAQAQGLLR